MDSGQQVSEAGAVPLLTSTPGFKKDEDKLRYDLLSASALQEMARVSTFGARKYPARNWEKGMAYGRIFAALMRHAWSWWMGEQNDPETGFNHMAHAMWCCMALCHFDLANTRYSEWDDRPYDNRDRSNSEQRPV